MTYSASYDIYYDVYCIYCIYEDD